MDAARDRGAGERIERSSAAAGGGAAQATRGNARTTSRAPQREARFVWLLFTFFRRAGLAVQAPECHLGVDLEHPRGNFRIAARSASTSRIFGAIMNSCFETMRGGSDVAGATRQACR